MTTPGPDHDLLIVINTKLDMFAASLAALATAAAADAVRFDARITVLERQADRQQGFWAGSRTVWMLLGALPPGVVVAILGWRAGG